MVATTIGSSLFLVKTPRIATAPHLKIYLHLDDWVLAIAGGLPAALKLRAVGPWNWAVVAAMGVSS